VGQPPSCRVRGARRARRRLLPRAAAPRPAESFGSAAEECRAWGLRPGACGGAEAPLQPPAPGLGGLCWGRGGGSALGGCGELCPQVGLGGGRGGAGLEPSFPWRVPSARASLPSRGLPGVSYNILSVPGKRRGLGCPRSQLNQKLRRDLVCSVRLFMLPPALLVRILEDKAGARA